MMRRLSRLAPLLLLLAACASAPGAAQPGAGAAGSRLTFVVLGDNRGDASGVQPPVFREIMASIDRTRPDLVFNTGDMIFGYTEDETVLRGYWAAYREVVGGLAAPLFHVPGNHDLFDETSARVYRELWGETSYSFDRENARFIALDTESEPNRLGEEQLRWLEARLEDAGDRHVFLFLHRPLFPVDGHAGNSLDAYPEERDRLHALLVRHRRSVGGVFQGHEHLLHFQERDGVPYYITGGAGANLYVPPELGGYHHYLRVVVEGERVSVEVERTGVPPAPPAAPRGIEPGTLLEDWERALLWYVWDHSVRSEVTREHASEGARGLKVHLDFSRVESPLLYAPLAPALDLGGADALRTDLFVPPEGASLSVAAVVSAGAQKASSPSRPLAPGWNRVVVPLDSGWLPPRLRRAVDQVEWVLSSEDPTFRGSVAFDAFRATAAGGGRPLIAEGWESPLAWGAWDMPPPRLSSSLATQGEQGLRIDLAFPGSPHPVLYAVLQPRWDLRRVSRIAADVYVPEGMGERVSARLGIVQGLREFEAPAVPLRTGWNRVAADLDGAWLAPSARAGAEQLRLRFLGDGGKLEGWVVVDNLRSERN